MSKFGGNLPTLLATAMLSSNAIAERMPEFNSSFAPTQVAESGQTSPWQSEVGAGFRRSAGTLNLEAGAAAGYASFGSLQAHDLALISLSCGVMGRTRGPGHWYRGNWELRAEIFGGSQYSPNSAWVVGLTPHLRYNFATGTRLIPFVDLGVGLTGTGIGLPDLSTQFEFNSQGAVGAHWFLRDHLALTVEARGIHISNAGIREPNNGVNAVMGMIGLTWFY